MDKQSIIDKSFNIQKEEKLDNDYLNSCAYLGICPICNQDLILIPKRFKTIITKRAFGLISDRVEEKDITPTNRIVCSNNLTHSLQGLEYGGSGRYPSILSPSAILRLNSEVSQYGYNNDDCDC